MKEMSRQGDANRKVCQGKGLSRESGRERGQEKEVPTERGVRRKRCERNRFQENKCQGKETTRGRDAKGKGCQETARCQGKELTGGRDAKR